MNLVVVGKVYVPNCTLNGEPIVRGVKYACKDGNADCQKCPVADKCDNGEVTLDA